MLMRFDPFRDVERLTQQAWGTQNRAPVMPMDAYRQGQEFIVHFDLPGVDPASIELTIEKNVLNVTAERSFPTRDGQELVVAERPQGTFTRQLFLGEGLDPDGIKAQYEQGVLTVTVPVAEAARPRKVQVQSGGGARAIDTSATG